MPEERCKCEHLSRDHSDDVNRMCSLCTCPTFNASHPAPSREGEMGLDNDVSRDELLRRLRFMADGASRDQGEIEELTAACAAERSAHAETLGKLRDAERELAKLGYVAT